MPEGDAHPVAGAPRVALGSRAAVRPPLRGRREATVAIMRSLVCQLLSSASPLFLTERNPFNVARQLSVVSIVARGQAHVIIAGGIDL
jgi:ribose/xylose/arabinose/galactoside ABC-type transport system permease subunit